jgi:hypothetical protein
VEQELLTLPVHLMSHPVFSVAKSSVYCIVFCRSLFVLGLLAIALSVIALSVIALSVIVLSVIALSVFYRFTPSYYPFGIFKIYLTIATCKKNS